MKILGYALMLAGFIWGLNISGQEGPDPRAGAPVAALLGVGFALLTAAGVRSGSVRGARRRINRDEQPVPFRVAVIIRYGVAVALVLGAIWLWMGL